MNSLLKIKLDRFTTCTTPRQIQDPDSLVIRCDLIQVKSQKDMIKLVTHLLNYSSRDSVFDFDQFWMSSFQMIESNYKFIQDSGGIDLLYSFIDLSRQIDPRQVRQRTIDMISLVINAFYNDTLVYQKYDALFVQHVSVTCILLCLWARQHFTLPEDYLNLDKFIDCTMIHRSSDWEFMCSDPVAKKFLETVVLKKVGPRLFHIIKVKLL